MGLSASKRVRNSLSQSPEFVSSCDSAFSYCLSQTQHAFQGVFPYQLPSASDYLHGILSTAHPHPLVLQWLPSPPTRSQVDSALRFVTRLDDDTLGLVQFKAWALQLYTDAVVASAGKAFLLRVPVGVAGIAGIGALTRSANHLVGTAIGAYTLGVAVSVFLGLSG
ncbi:Transmembrane protein [Senna tora]|uniref:Transmembrane protein n=1 Tax=Senna tora TaxID=362788 RepID=A0A834WKG7_9FABA|nr:Transmembrane protein [Senna tora]